jgi:PEP-CTERM motif
MSSTMMRRQEPFCYFFPVTTSLTDVAATRKQSKLIPTATNPTMKHFLKTAVLASAGVALLAQSAAAQNAFTQGDLMLSFREAGHNDLIIDIGQVSTYLNSSVNINLDNVVAAAGNSTFMTLSSLIDNVFGSPAGVTWSVSGDLKPGSAVTALYLTNPGNAITTRNQSQLTLGGNAVNTMSQSGYVTTPNTLVVNLATDPTSASGGSYTGEHSTVAAQSGITYETAIPSSGNSVANFYVFTPNSADAPVPGGGFFEINSGGSGEYVVPEPSTCALIALGGVLALAFRRQFSRQPI